MESKKLHNVLLRGLAVCSSLHLILVTSERLLAIKICSAIPIHCHNSKHKGIGFSNLDLFFYNWRIEIYGTVTMYQNTQKILHFR